MDTGTVIDIIRSNNTALTIAGNIVLTVITDGASANMSASRLLCTELNHRLSLTDLQYRGWFRNFIYPDKAGIHMLRDHCHVMKC